ncbi:MAG: POTRA domain-containing protein [Pyrinomonadaceae bacterium]
MSHYKFQPRFVWLSLIALLIFSLSTFAQQSKLVEAVDILGNRRLSDEELLKHIKIRPGQKFDERKLQEDFQSLLKLGSFNTTNTKVLTEEGIRGGVNVIFEIAELPIIAKLNFEGLRYITSEEILTELREKKAEIKVGEFYKPARAIKARHIITEYLNKRGFADAKVFVSEDVVSATDLTVTFVIDEKPNDDN